MSLGRRIYADHPLKGRMAHLPTLLCPSETLSLPDQRPVDNQGSRSANSPMATVARVAGQKRRRPRAARACESCRAKKYRCDERDPCSKCERRNTPCIYKDADLARERFHSTIRDENGVPGQRQADGNHDDASEVPEPDQASHDDEHGEVTEINMHTLNTEFHGPTSSLAFLATVQQHAQEDTSSANRPSQSLVSAFHNESFSPESTLQKSGEEQSLSSNRYYFRQSRFFLDGYFQNLHFIHPVIDRADFFTRCEDLWFGQSDKQPRSFVALYYAVLSLGAIIQEWDEDKVDGMGRFEWSRKMFRHAADALGLTPGNNDLETVQANLVMAKVCQNELNPHLAYMYLGRAVRTALSAGHNRLPSRILLSAQTPRHSSISKTWWGLYSLEVEMSFSVGRPDSLGSDVYHNQAMPSVDDSEHAILTTMVDFARITRKVSIAIYASSQPIIERLDRAVNIEHAIDEWAEALPVSISLVFAEEKQASTTSKEPKWARKQRHTLSFRYYNVKMVLYRPFLIHAAVKRNDLQPELQAAVGRCVAAARSTIFLMHEMYCKVSYFRTWFYNVTYTLYAASIILCYLARLAGDEEKEELRRLIDMSIDVLNAMKNHVVAKKAANILQHASAQVQDKRRSNGTGSSQQSLQTIDTSLMYLANLPTGANQDLPANDSFLDPFSEVNLDFMNQFFPLDDNYLSPWPS